MKGRVNELKQIKSKFGRFGRILSGFLAAVLFISGVPTTAFAWGTEGQVCSSKYGDRYVGADGQYYYAASVVDFIAYDDNGNVSVHSNASGNARRKYLLVEADGTERHVFCIEAGIPFTTSTNTYTSTSGQNSRYFQNLPLAAREGIMLTTVYGYQPGMSSPVSGTNADDFAVATQIILWEYQQQLRTSPTRLTANAWGIPADNFLKTIQGRPAEKCYNWILEQCANHLVVPSFCNSTHTLKYNPSTKNFSITLTDTNNTYADIKFDDAKGISVSRSGNQYTFTTSQMITSPVSLTAHKNVPQVQDNMLIWGRPGQQTMMCGAEDPVVMRLSFQTEGYGSCNLIKKSEDGKVGGIRFQITGNGENRTVTTSSNGTFQINNLLPGTYTITEVTENRYEAQSAKTVTIRSGETAEVTFSNTLKRGDLKIEKICDDNLVAGLKFRVTASVIGYDRTFETNEQGEIFVEGLQVYDSNNQLIRYVVEEVDTPIRYEPVTAQSSTIIYGGEVSLTFKNETKTQVARISKVSEDGHIEGLKFKVTSDNGYEGIYTTDAEGRFTTVDLPVYNTSNEVITYTVTEIDTPVKFVQPETKTFNLTGGDVTVSFSNKLKKFRVEVKKSDAETGERAQGDASLAGAKYGLYNDGELMDTFTTDASGYFITPYYICGDNWEIKEISPSEGYLLDPMSYHVGAEAKLYSVEYNTTENLVTEDVIKGQIAIIKHADDGSTQIETPEEGATFQLYLASAGSFENALESERDTLICDADGFAQSKPLPYGRYICKQIAGAQGTEFMPDFTIFVSEDGEIYKYLINNAPFTSYLKIVKVDSETGNTIPYEGAAFQIYDENGQRVVMKYTYPTLTEVDTFYTSSEGYLITPERLYPGNYYLHEVQAPYGYVLNEEPIPFTIDDEFADYSEGVTVVAVEVPNAPQKGIISIKKTGEVFESVAQNGETYLPVYSVKGLAGVPFNVIADENITTPDGSLRYAKGTIVDTIITSETGEGQSKPLYLGRYRIEEAESVHGMLLAEPQIVELVYEGQFVELTEASASFYNERQKVSIELEKVIEQDETFGIGMDGEEVNITFGLFADEDIVAADGSMIPKDGLLEVIRVAQSGRFSFTVDAPLGSYYVKELTTAGPEYILDDTKYPVVFEYQGPEIPVVQVKVNDGEPLVNRILYGSIEGLKIDEEKTPLGGALIGLFFPNETEFTKENAILTDISKPDGSFEFEKVAAGHWIVAEIEQPQGFILSLDIHHVYINTDGVVISITMENERIRGNVQLTKYDEDYPDNKLEDAEFKVYTDVNGNGELDEEDIFLSVMDEVEAGIYELKGLIGQSYLLFESKAPEGFELDETVYSFVIDEHGETVVIENEAGIGFMNKAQKGSLVIEKTSEDQVLEGFEFLVEGTDFLGNAYQEIFKTDAEGRIEIALRPGQYTVSEKGSEETVRYVLPDAQTVEIKAGEESSLKFENLLKTGSIRFMKIDQVTGEPLAGVLFRIYDADENVIAEGKTGRDGIVQFDGLKFGVHFWQEAESIPGYRGDTSLHEFEIVEHEQLITITVANEPVTDVPKTGDTSNMALWLSLLGLSSAGAAGAAVLSRRKRKEK